MSKPIKKTKSNKSPQKQSSTLAEAILDLNNKLINLENIDEIFALSLAELQKFLVSPYSLFAVLHESEALVQLQLGKYSAKEKPLTLNADELETLYQPGIVMQKQKIFLPIFLQNKLIGLIILEPEKNLLESEKTYSTNLLRFSNFFSNLISERQIFSDLKAVNENLLNQDKYKTELISTVSHELRTPLTNIMGFSELLSKNFKGDEKLGFYLNEIYHASLRLANTTNNYLDLARIEAKGNIQISHLEKAEIDWLAEKSWESLNFTNQKYKLVFEKPKVLHEVLCDPDAIMRVFTNLFSNAIKYSNPINESDSTTIVCKIQEKKESLEISIIDHGIGIPAGKIENLFEKFYRVENDSRNFINGSGLGLWICKEIINAHGGTISCSSEPEKGTNFTFTLPKGNKINIDAKNLN